MAALEKKLNVKILKVKNKRIFLDELGLNVGRKQKEPDMQCGLWCGETEDLKEQG